MPIKANNKDNEINRNIYTSKRPKNSTRKEVYYSKIKDNGYKENRYKEDGYKENRYKEDGYKENRYKEDEYKEDGYKENRYKGNNRDKDITKPTGGLIKPARRDAATIDKDTLIAGID